MDRETARQTIRSMISCKDYLEKSPKGNYCCPFCGSGTGPNRSGALQYYENTNTWHCFSCDRTGDVIDLEQHKTGADYNEALSLLADSLGIAIDSYRPGGGALGWNDAIENDGYSQAARTAAAQRDFSDQEKPDQNQTKTERPAAAQAGQAATDQPEQGPQADYTDYYRVCRRRLKDPAALAYLKKRGISQETAAAYWLGYDPAADPASAPGAIGEERKAHPAPRLILPTGTGHYVARRIDDITEFAKLNPAGSKPGLFNTRILNDPEITAVFVTEGIFDALAIIEAGAPAIALNSTANAEALIKRLEARPTVATLILCLDNDGAGSKATETIKAGLRRLNISFITADICGACKDPNEALVTDKQAFTAAILEAQRRTAARPDNTSFYIDHFLTADIAKFISSKKSTGFELLDQKAGGLYAGLYVLAALSSLGKTSFSLQLADQLAAAGTDVIFFSMEQSKLELVTKSLARITAQADKSQAINSLAIRGGYYADRVQAAAAEYKQRIGERFTVVEGNFNCNISFICDYIRRYISKNQAKPVVIVDYLQIVQAAEEPGKPRQSVRETVDETLTTLARLSRELWITIIVISSVNRSNYLTPIDFESLKESGGIEFTADAVWGLQLRCLNDELFDQANKIKEKREMIRRHKVMEPRQIELVCLKNRFGRASFSCYFDYYAAMDLFEEVPAIEEQWTEAPNTKKAGNK